jgi:hypothetical protein
VLAIAPEGDNTRLSQHFTGETNEDEIAVIVDSQTLKPISSTREIIEGGEEEVTLEVTYSEEGALIKQDERQSGMTVPEHAYDNDTSLFLWRTIPFADGYSASYVTVITNRRNTETVTLTVLGKESVTVPAGTFDTWKLEIRSGDVVQLAWYADTAERPLVKYDNSQDLFFELVPEP